MDASCEDVVSHNNENVDKGPTTVSQPKYDPYFNKNEKIIHDLLIDEKRYHSSPGFCVRQPHERTIWMRRTLLNWLRDVCVHRGSDCEVLAHTAQLVDRYMHVVPTDQREYQLVGATCFFITSKLKETIPISVKRIAEYSDNSIAEPDILAKELTVCILLKWDLTCITPVDFVAPVVEFLEFVPSLRQIIRQAALCIFIKTFHVETLGMYLPSYIAAACILYALNLTVLPDLSDVAIRSVTRIQQLLRLEAHKMREVYQVLQACFEPGTVQLSKAVRDGDIEPQTTIPLEITSYSNEITKNSPSSGRNCTVPIPVPQSSYTQFVASAAEFDRSANSFDASFSSNSIGSTGPVSGSTSFDQTYVPVTTNSLSACSTSSPPSESEILGSNDSETKRCQPNLSHSRQSLPQIPYAHSVKEYHPNVCAAGQILSEQKLVHQTWGAAVAGLMRPLSNTADMLALKAALLVEDPRFIILKSTHPPVNSKRRWTPTDVREVQLE